MEISSFGKVATEQKKHAPGSVKQTGFPSPATHYLEPSINLQDELITNRDATFFIRISGNGYASYAINDGDVLIIDRSSAPRENDLALMIEDGAFKITRIARKSTSEDLILWGKITYIIHKAQ
ncbi:S24 family peptidase [Flavimarina sp. Hel_I_48]|uniref:S24 family peptidase n=1 Tax=Flavimarina sp. Hel_I_48 TaxID=1392488 RepID=UPI0004DED356|nr:S24 family peptidase [Flavimarina sp. Hel_I_48]